MTSGRFSANRGLTLIELIVVLSMIGVLLAVSSTSFSLSGWLSTHRLKRSAREIFLHMQKARANAVKENRDWALLFDPFNNRYRFQYQDSGGWTDNGDYFYLAKNIDYSHGTAPFDASDDNNPFASNNPPDQVTFTGNRATFGPLGLPTKSGYCYIANGEGDTYAIGANNVGAIKLKHWNGNDWE